jgi:hypothetical protein
VNWTSSRDVHSNIGLMVGRDAEIKFLVNTLRPDDITLVIGESIAEITFCPSMVETLRDKADEAVCQLREATATDKAAEIARGDHDPTMRPQ